MNSFADRRTMSVRFKLALPARKVSARAQRGQQIVLCSLLCCARCRYSQGYFGVDILRCLADSRSNPGGREMDS
jgi:hypothetical protein